LALFFRFCTPPLPPPPVRPAAFPPQLPLLRAGAPSAVVAAPPPLSSLQLPSACMYMGWDSQMWLSHLQRRL
jgi:hypothetical protein